VTPFVDETASLKLMEEAHCKGDSGSEMENRNVLSRDSELAALSPLEVLAQAERLFPGGVILLELDRVGTLGLDQSF
jgi:hypothetical protein